MKSYEAVASLTHYSQGRLVCNRTGKFRDTTKQTAGYAACKASVNGKVYRDLVHRVIWFMHHGIIPDGMEIDHIDRDKLNNSIENLRLVTREGNCHNINSVGVYFNLKRNKWVGYITESGKQRNLGSYDTIIDARAVYIKEKQRIQSKLY